MFDATGDFLRNTGNEFGSTTGRPRRCGWIDLVALQFACMINGVTQIVMTKADILDGLEELKVCNSYKINGEEISRIPFQMNKMPIDASYQSFKGWKNDITQVKTFENMPAEMNTYINYLNEFLKVPVKYISNGPGRDQLVNV